MKLLDLLAGIVDISWSLVIIITLVFHADELTWYYGLIIWLCTVFWTAVGLSHLKDWWKA